MTTDDDGQFLATSNSIEPQGDKRAEDEPSGSVSGLANSPTNDVETPDRAARRKRHVRLFCFSCNRYEGHSVAAKSRWLYSFLVGATFGLYYIFGRYSCHCCGTVRLARRDWLNPRFWYRTLWLGGIVTKKSKTKSRSRRKG